MWRRNPQARFADISHSVHNESRRHAFYLLSSACWAFPAGTVHVVDVRELSPEQRRRVKANERPLPFLDCLAARCGDQFFLLENNGILPMLAAESRPVTEVVKLTRHADFEKCYTFNALNYYVDAAARLAAGATLADVGEPYPADALERMLLPGRTFNENMLVGSVLHIDAHGNLITDIREEELLEVCGKPKKMTVRVGECLESLPEVSLRKNYLGVMPGTVFAVTNLAGYIELVQKNGSLAALLYGQDDMLSGIGDTVTLHFG